MSTLPAARLAWLAGALLLASAAALLAACGDDGTPAPVPTAGATIETIRSEDGLDLDGRLFAAAPERLVILLHMFPADQTAWYPFARELQARGTSALTLDFRGYGASEGGKDPGEIDRDVRAALAFARERGYERVVLIGSSMGGTAAIVVAAAQPVDGVISLSAPSRMRGLDATVAIGKVDAPLALAAAAGDLSALNALEGLAERAGLDAGAQLVVPGRAHGSELLESASGDEVSAWLLAFLGRVWGG